MAEPKTYAKKKCGRVSRYSELVGMLPAIRQKLQGGMTEKEVCRDIGFSWSTWSRYKTQHEEFVSFISNCRDKPSDEVKGAMYRAATGHTAIVRKAMKVKTIEYKDGHRLREHEDIVEYSEEVYCPPNVTAGIFLLTNWKPDEYARDARAAQLREREIALKEKQAEEESW